MDRDKQSAAQSMLLKDFDSSIKRYEAFCSTVVDLIKRLLAAKKIEVHSISGRCKERISFEKKIRKKGRYKSLDEITDLAGIRIITHYSDDVDVIAALVEKEFDVDRQNSIDKRVALDPDRFGYLSLHYVASLKSTRSKLQEYLDYDGLKVEIQIRSILQHTWAEIEHDIGYKNEIEVPGPIKRKFSRLAGLLELADQEFISIRKEIDKYAKTLDRQLANSTKNVGLDALSFEKFVTRNKVSLKLDEQICKVGRYEIGSFKNESGLVLRLANADITTIERLSELLVKYEKDIVRMTELVRDLPDDDPSESAAITKVSPGISSFYLLHVLAALKSPEDIEQYIVSNNWHWNDEEHQFYNVLVGFFGGSTQKEKT